MRAWTAAATAILLAGVTGMASASDPSSGTISTASPKVEWGGTVASSGITANAWAQDPTFQCQTPACDSFALKVAENGNVALTLTGFNENTAGGDPTCDIRVIKPDGSPEHFNATCGPNTTMKVTLKNAAAGDYAIDVASSHVASPESGTEDYKASATLVGAAAPAPAATPVATAAPAPVVTLSAKVPALSARKLAKTKKFTATLKSSGALSGVNALLVNKKKQVGSGKLATLNGTAKLTVKLKARLKPGTYQLSVGGTDAQGRSAVAAVKVKVKK